MFVLTCFEARSTADSNRDAALAVVRVGVNAALGHRGLDPLVAREEASAHVT